MSTKRWIILAIVIVIVLVLSVVGYTLYGEYTASTNLSVGVAGLGAQDIGLSGATIVLKINFSNPTNYATPTFATNFSVFIGNVFIGNGTLPEVGIQPKSSAVQTILLPVNYTTVGATIIRALSQGQYNLTLTGIVHAKVLSGMIPIAAHYQVNRSCPSLNSNNCTQNYTYSF